MRKDRKHIAAIVAVNHFFNKYYNTNDKIAWSDYSSVGWMTQKRNM